MPLSLVEVDRKLKHQRQLVVNRDFPAYASNYSVNGRLFVDHDRVIEGRQAIEDYVRQRQEAQPGLKIDYKATGVDEVGDCVISYGTYTSTAGDTQDSGKWLHVLCNEDGSLKIKYSMWNSSLPHHT